MVFPFCDCDKTKALKRRNKLGDLGKRYLIAHISNVSFTLKLKKTKTSPVLSSLHVCPLETISFSEIHKNGHFLSSHIWQNMAWSPEVASGMFITQNQTKIN